MDLNKLISTIKSQSLDESVRAFLFREEIPAFSNAMEYDQFKKLALEDHPTASKILIGGSGNWGYSFNPNKLFNQFSSKSDIDLVIVSNDDFIKSWKDLRTFHRTNWYQISPNDRIALRRNGENVYSGFITPKWIPSIHDAARMTYEERSNRYSTDIVGYRKVSIMYFKNETELVDYYKRSFNIVKNYRSY